MEMTTPGALMLVAGEASGDLHGATLAGELRRLAPSISLVGMGGPRMAEAGVGLLSDLTRLAVVGSSEAVGRLPALFRAYRLLVSHLREQPPRAVILIDFPEFNLRIARVARGLGIPVVYFIPPQVWAWRRGRVRVMARLATRVLAIFPFEVPLYERAGARVEFVGHPVLDSLGSPPARLEARRLLGTSPEGTLVGLLPGSRREEVARLLPEMLRAAGLIQASRPETRFLLAPAPAVESDLVNRLVAAARVEVGVATGRTQEVMAAADLLLVASGTATLEAALVGTPMVVCYRVSRVSGLLGRLLVRIPWISLVNIVAARAVVPELLQGDATGERMAEAALHLLGSPVACQAQRVAFGEIRRRLGSPGVGERAARSALEAAGVPCAASLTGTIR